MTMSLFFRPHVPTEGKPLGFGMKWALQKRYELSSSPMVLIRETDMAWLEGVRDGVTQGETKESAEQLIEALEEHGAVEVWIE